MNESLSWVEHNNKWIREVLASTALFLGIIFIFGGIGYCMHTENMAKEKTKQIEAETKLVEAKLKLDALK